MNRVAMVLLCACCLLGAMMLATGDKMILGGNGEGCGPKFIFKSVSRHHKEFFILNECQQDGTRQEPHGSPTTPVVKYVPLGPRRRHHHPSEVHQAPGETAAARHDHTSQAHSRQRYRRMQNYIVRHFLKPTNRNKH